MGSPGGAVFLLCWFLLIAAASEIAHRKNRGQWSWVLATFFFGPIALIPLLALPRRSAATHHNAA
jgi:hypothetical protein